jgi:hypothetical protein
MSPALNAAEEILIEYRGVIDTTNTPSWFPVGQIFSVELSLRGNLEDQDPDPNVGIYSVTVGNVHYRDDFMDLDIPFGDDDLSTTIITRGYGAHITANNDGSNDSYVIHVSGLRGPDEPGPIRDTWILTIEGGDFLSSDSLFPPDIDDAESARFDGETIWPFGGVRNEWAGPVVSLFAEAVETSEITCLVAMDQAAYGDGTTATATTFSISSSVQPLGSITPVEIKVWIEYPNGDIVPAVNDGADGSVGVISGFPEDFAPVPVLPVDSSTPRGSYVFGFRLLDPFTGQELCESQALFQVVN